ncbi:MAG: type II secretion system F family protein [Pseudomonadales bacterium]|nr:type II secretion system F family protein [Pseudomonadales bacterium]
MSQYQYTCRNQSGDTVKGILDAANEENVATELLQTGLTPITIQIVNTSETFDLDIAALLPSARVGLEELIIFSKQMYSLSKAGIAMIRALNGLSESTFNPTLRKAIKAVLHSLESGQPLAQALSQHPRIFSDLYVSVVHVGENSGRLDEAFLQLAGYLELERETIKRIKSATRYPTFVIIAMSIGLVIINIFVIPAFSGVFAKLGAELPWQTQVLISFSNFMLNYWPLLLLLLMGSLVGIKFWLKTPAGRYRWDGWKLKLPVLGSLFERIHLGRFCRSFSMMLRSGIPIVQGLNVVSHALGNDYMAERVRGMRQNIERGESFLQAAAMSKLFTPLVMQMISVGEETGGIDEMLAEAADFYEQEVDYELKGLADAIEPIMIIGIGAMVLVLALGVFLPLWDLSSAASR